jgi:hypothetical protein
MHRMPVILSPDDVALCPIEKEGDRPGLMKPCPGHSRPP